MDAIADCLALATRVLAPEETTLTLYVPGDSDPGDPDRVRYLMPKPLLDLVLWMGLRRVRAEVDVRLGPDLRDHDPTALATLGPIRLVPAPKGTVIPTASTPLAATLALGRLAIGPRGLPSEMAQPKIHETLLATDRALWADVVPLETVGPAVRTLLPGAIHSLEQQVVWASTYVLVAGVTDPLLIDTDTNTLLLSATGLRATLGKAGGSVHAASDTRADADREERHHKVLTDAHHGSTAEEGWAAAVCLDEASASPVELCWPDLLLRLISGGDFVDLRRPSRWQAFGLLWPHHTLLQVLGLAPALSVTLGPAQQPHLTNIRAELTYATALVLAQQWLPNRVQPSRNCDRFVLEGVWDLRTGTYRAHLTAEGGRPDQSVAQALFLTTLRLIHTGEP